MNLGFGKSPSQAVSTNVDFSQWRNLTDMLEQACNKYSESVALTCLGTDLTFRQFDRLASQLASYLQNDLGLKKGDRLAIMLPNVMQFPIAFYAAQKIGVICVNTNPLYTPREMRHQFKDSGAKAIIILDLVSKGLEEILHETDIKHVIVTSIGDQLPGWKAGLIGAVLKLKGQVPKLKIQTISFKAALAAGAKKNYTRPEIESDDIAVLQYTGGTTGVSKGAMLLHRNILANMIQIQTLARAQITDGGELVLTALPLYHIFALSVNFLAFIAMGNRMILVPKPVPIKNLIKVMRKYPITVMTGVNTLFNALLNDKEFCENPPRTLKVALGGGMAVQEVVNKKWTALTGQPIVEGFGLTEASPVTHVNPLDKNLIKYGSVGFTLPGTEAKIMNEDGQEVALGEVGELVVRGPQVMAGYWQRPDETAKVIRNGWLWTGDIAKRDGTGYFYIVDRKKDMILVSGFNVYPNEIEEVLMSHPKVLEAAVVGVPDPSSGEAVKAFVVAKDKSLTKEELKAHCHAQLTGYKRPNQFEFRDELPKTNVGKILRRKLRDETETSTKLAAVG
ncbi:MAG: AMP-binding protein [Deltaproteobacteria bacterium]|nr:AMP-binding protein [Deltaproteobacteria bacterium]